MKRKIDVNTVVKNIVLEIKMTGIVRFKIRLFFAAWLIKLAVWILGCEIQFEIKNKLND